MLFIKLPHWDMFLLYIKAEHMEKHPYTDDKISHNILTEFSDDVTLEENICQECLKR